MSDQLQDYIKQARAAGQSDEQIKEALLKAGWSENIILEALAGKVVPSSPVIGAKRKIKCAHCGYTGPGRKGRSTWAEVLAQFAIIFTPVITILYYLFYRSLALWPVWFKTGGGNR